MYTYIICRYYVYIIQYCIIILSFKLHSFDTVYLIYEYIYTMYIKIIKYFKAANIIPCLLLSFDSTRRLQQYSTRGTWKVLPILYYILYCTLYSFQNIIYNMVYTFEVLYLLQHTNAAVLHMFCIEQYNTEKMVPKKFGSPLYTYNSERTRTIVRHDYTIKKIIIITSYGFWWVDTSGLTCRDSIAPNGPTHFGSIFTILLCFSKEPTIQIFIQ